MIEKKQLLNFYPPLLDGNIKSEKRRYMLVYDIDNKNNKIKMFNISSIKQNNEKNLWYDFNFELKDYYPLSKPSFIKLNTIYIMENFKGLEKYISKKGEKIKDKQFNEICKQKNIYEQNNKIKVINYKIEEFKKCNVENLSFS